MYSIDSKINERVNECIQNERVLSIRIPEGEPYSGTLINPKFTVLCYEKEKQKICINTPKNHSFLGFINWIIKVILFIIQTIVVIPVSIYTIYSLLVDLVKLGRLPVNEKRDVNLTLIRHASKYFKVHRNPQKKQCKIKKILFFAVDKTLSREDLGSILILCEFVHRNQINNIGIVIISTIDINQLDLKPLVLEDNAIDNAFLYDFNHEILDCIRNKQYFEAAKSIHKFLRKNGIHNISEFEFVMQCLAFCYQNLSINDFIQQFDGTNLDVNKELDNGRVHHFIEETQESLFLKFCYRYLLQFYCARSGVSDDKYRADFQCVVSRIRSTLTSKKDYLAAAKLGAKFLNSEEGANLFIVACVHIEYVENQISDECLNYLKIYAEHHVERAQQFCKLYEGNISYRNANAVLIELDRIATYGDIDPLVKLCFYYYLADLMYVYNVEPSSFMCRYSEALNQVQALEALKCLFSAQFVLFYTTVEDQMLRSKYAKQVSSLLKYVFEHMDFLNNRKLYIKICRSLNGIRCDCFQENLSDMLLVQEEVKNFKIEKIYYDINLGVLYIYRGEKKDYNTALTIYRNIDKKLLALLPLRVRVSYFNNLYVIEYLNQPSVKTARQKYLKIKNCLKEVTSNYTVLEEKRHLYINFIIFACIAGESDKKIRKLIQYAETLISDDNYFIFYLQQCKNLFFTLTGQNGIAAPAVLSVFFLNKRSFFKEKLDIMQKLAQRGPSTLGYLNECLENELAHYSSDYNYFKRADLFSLDERWYE